MNRHEKKQRQDLHLNSSFPQSDSLSYPDFQVWVKDCCAMPKTQSEMGTSGKKVMTMKIHKFQQN